MKSTEKGLIKSRFIFLLGLISVMLLGLFIRSFYLQYLESDFLNTEGEKKHIKYISIPANRGSIYDRNGIPLAVSIPVYKLAPMLLQLEMKGVLRPLPGKFFELV